MLDSADNLFEEVEPVAVLKARKNENGTRDFLVKWSDGSEDSWVCAGRSRVKYVPNGFLEDAKWLPAAIYLNIRR